MCFISCSTTNNTPSSSNHFLVKLQQQYWRLSADQYSIFGSCVERNHTKKKRRRKEGNKYDHHCITYVTKYLVIPTNPQKSINLYNTHTKNFVCYVLIICTSFLTTVFWRPYAHHNILYTGCLLYPNIVVRLFTTYLMWIVIKGCPKTKTTTNTGR